MSAAVDVEVALDDEAGAAEVAAILFRRLPGEWQRRSACAHHPRPDFWFPDGEQETYETQVARAICRTCPVQGPCLEYALEAREEHGIWGGTSERERRRIRRWTRRLM